MAPLRPEPDRRPDALRGSREPRQWGRISLVLAGVAFVIWLGWSVIKTDYYRSAIPQEIGLVLGLATTGSESSMLSWLLPIRPQSCGGAIFELDDATARAIRERGIGFFNGVTQGRGVPDPAYQMYKPWQETPLPDGWISPSMARPVVHGAGAGLRRGHRRVGEPSRLVLHDGIKPTPGGHPGAASGRLHLLTWHDRHRRSAITPRAAGAASAEVKTFSAVIAGHSRPTYGVASLAFTP